MLKFEKSVPIKQTYTHLASFPRFSLIQKIAPKFYPTSQEASITVARLVVEEIRKKNAKGQTFVLGLATGSTPLRVYKELVRIHKEEGFSFKNVVTFNLDEYYPISKQDPESYNHYMNHNFFNHIDIPKQNINIPDGEIERNSVTEYCQKYEEKIKSYGGVDLQILGIGRTGHIGFNEPPAPINSVTRLVYLHRLTRKDAATAFGGMEKVPKCAITMGINTIKKARKIIIMAWSESKAYIVKRCIEGELTTEVPSTFLHEHPDATFYLDKAAGQMLSRFNIPWTIKGDSQDPIVPNTSYWTLKRVTWLSEICNKPILRLTYDDYEDNHLAQLVIDCAGGSVEDLNLYVYKKIISRITGWPLGNRPLDSQKPENMTIAKKANISEKVLIFSPHPDDDVISMGGTIRKLQQQGHQIHVAYMTTGSNAVFDHDAKKYMYFLRDFTNQYLWDQCKENPDSKFVSEFKGILEKAVHNLQEGSDEERQTQFNMQIKRYIRSSEAKIAINSLGVSSEHAYCLNLPFYGAHLKKKQVSEDDYEIVRSLLRLIQPTVVYAAGDLTDPHGTHRKCLEILLKLQNEDKELIAKNQQPLFPPPNRIYLYRGAWQEWGIAMARMFVPLSPKQVAQKLASILKHQTQKDNPMFPGDDKRQFWERVQQRNRSTAELLNKLGFPDYEAAECFVDLNDFLNYDDI